MKDHRTTSADGHHEEPLPTDIPTDCDHIATPRDIRAEKLARDLDGRTPRPLETADGITRIEAAPTSKTRVAAGNTPGTDQQAGTVSDTPGAELARVRAELTRAEQERDHWKTWARRHENRLKRLLHTLRVHNIDPEKEVPR